MSTDHPDVLDRLAAVGRELDEVAPPISVDEVIGRRRRASRPVDTLGGDARRRRGWPAAAAVVLIVGGVVGIVVASGEPSNEVNDLIGTEDMSHSTAVLPSAVTVVPRPPWSEPVADSPSTSSADVAIVPNDSVVERVASLDAWSAARLFRLEAQYGASPEEWADLAVANELRSRECLMGLGVELDPFDST
ncbi:MAG: hypothetical protein AAGF91_05925, partial [Actinomycetota bacterium]